jgi:O-antigen ligase
MTIANQTGPVPTARGRVRMLRPKADKLVVWAVSLCIATYYGANAYQGGVSSLLTIVKWPLLALVAGTALLALTRAGRLRPAAYFPVFLFLAALSTNLIDSVDEKASAATFGTVVFVIVAARLVAANFDHIALRKRFFDVLWRIGVVIVAATAPMYVLGINLGRSGRGRFSAWTDNPNTLGAILAPLLVVMLAGILARRRGWQWRHGLPFMVSLFLLYQTGSRAALLWVCVSAIAFWIYRKGVSFGALLAAVALVLFVGWRDQIAHWILTHITREGLRSHASFDALVSGRGEAWQIGWTLAQDKPWLGYGFGTSPQLIDAYDWFFSLHQGGHFHNSYMTVLVEGGAFGLVTLCAMLALALGKGLQEARQTRSLPRQEWPFVALPWVMLLGAMGHAIFESWLLAAGNANALVLWTCIWMMYETGRRGRAPVPRQPPGRPPALR